MFIDGIICTYIHTFENKDIDICMEYIVCMYIHTYIAEQECDNGSTHRQGSSRLKTIQETSSGSGT